MSSLPEDIIIEILSKLPVKPLLRLKCISKSMYALISSPYFIKQHLHLSLQSNDHQKFVVEYMYRFKIYDASYFNNLTFRKFTSKYTYPLSGKKKKHTYPFLETCTILSSCNGLLLVSTGSRNLTLWNPSTGESRELPKSCDASYYALGYDSSTDDYKVIQQEKTNHGFSYQVFSLRSNYWRNINDFKSDIMRSSDCFYINLNGALHWLEPINMKRKIVCFTLAEEKFIEMEMELPDDFHTSSNVNLSVLEGCLCLSETIFKPRATYFSVWLMKEFGVKASWTKFITIPKQPIIDLSSTRPSAAPFCFMKQKAIFVINQRYKDCVSMFIVGDLENEEFEIVTFDRYIRFRTYLTFVESLVSPFKH